MPFTGRVSNWSWVDSRTRSTVAGTSWANCLGLVTKARDCSCTGLREPTNEYVFPEDVYNQKKMQALFDRIPLHCFQGHTHIPGIFTVSGDFLSPEEFDFEYRLGGEKAMVNVGSVGQPRDGDPRACYAILTDDTIVFRRVSYPVEETIAKIYKEPDLDNMLGDRLREGR